MWIWTRNQTLDLWLPMVHKPLCLQIQVPEQLKTSHLKCLCENPPLQLQPKCHLCIHKKLFKVTFTSMLGFQNLVSKWIATTAMMMQYIYTYNTHKKVIILPGWYNGLCTILEIWVPGFNSQLRLKFFSWNITGASYVHVHHKY